MKKIKLFAKKDSNGKYLGSGDSTNDCKIFKPFCSMNIYECFILKVCIRKYHSFNYYTASSKELILKHII